MAIIDHITLNGTTLQLGAGGASSTWFTGAAVTGTGTSISAAVTDSKAGDMYLNTDTYNVYKATAADTWGYVCNIKGGSGDSVQIFFGTAVDGTGTNISAVVANSKTGDTYVNTSNYNIYSATAASVWDYKGCIKGADGTTPTIDSAPTSGSENAVSSGGVYTALGGKLDKNGGTMTGNLIASNPAVDVSAVRNIVMSTTDLTAGTSYLPTGTLYFVFE